MADRERYARDRERIRARQNECAKKNRPKWIANAKAKHDASPYRQTLRAWKLMKRRCYDQKCDKFQYYGGRGISVCQRWLDSFDNFIADVGLRPPGLTLDRIYNDGNYEPGNVRWATHSQQMLNRRLPSRQIPTCTCGQCVKCKGREAVKRYRARKKAGY